MDTIDQNILREIKSSFRQSMNADLSDGMRKNGLIYRMNFGVPSPRIRLIADRFNQDVSLATYLWNEDVRESKMLATYLYPYNEMDIDTAVQWCSEIKYTEIADQLCRNLLVLEPYARELSDKLISADNDMMIYAGYRLMIQMMQKDIKMVVNDEFIRLAMTNAERNIIYINNLILNLFSRLIESEYISIADISNWEKNPNKSVAGIYNALSFY